MLSIKTLYILILRGFIKWHLKTKLITENLFGAKIYKDYNFYNGKNIGFKPCGKEKVETITAGELLKLYQKQNTVL